MNYEEITNPQKETQYKEAARAELFTAWVKESAEKLKISEDYFLMEFI